METALIILAWLTILVGLIGTVVPILPGTPLMFAGMLTIAWIDSFAHVGWGTLSLLLFLTIFSIVIDFIASLLGAQRVGASSLALVGAALGTIGGLFFGLIGIFIGPFIGAVVGELIERRDVIRAGTVGFATWIGIILGTAVKLAVACMMAGIFVFFYFV